MYYLKHKCAFCGFLCFFLISIISQSMQAIPSESKRITDASILSNRLVKNLIDFS